MLKKLADKNETKKVFYNKLKSLLFLEKRINELSKINLERSKENSDLLAAKAPLNWSCLSCDVDFF